MAPKLREVLRKTRGFTWRLCSYRPPVISLATPELLAGGLVRASVIISVIEVTPTSRNRDKTLELLRFTVDRLQTMRGCLRADVYQSSDERRTILYLECWESDAEFRRYVKSSLYLNVLNALDLSRDTPVTNFYEVSNIKAMEFIAALRS